MLRRLATKPLASVEVEDKKTGLMCEVEFHEHEDDWQFVGSIPGTKLCSVTITRHRKQSEIDVAVTALTPAEMGGTERVNAAYRVLELAEM